MRNSASSPARVYRRGQRVVMKWARNNHHGGLFRISLVPVQHMFDRSWHARLTLLHGCFESGLTNCRPGEDCGTDKKREVFARTVQIPNVFKDGVYVVGYVWYGGTRFQEDFGQFSDYYSCSFVRIQGGNPLGGTYKAFFEPGQSSEIRNGKCLTSAAAIGECPEGCENRRSFYAIPKVFAQGGLPPITVGSVDGSGGKGNLGSGTGAMQRGQDKRSGGNSGNNNSNLNAGPRNSGGGTNNGGNGTGNSPRGLCSGNVCCTASCGRCGGSGCNRLPGGAANCCTSVIRSSGRVCTGNIGAPCVRSS